MGIIRQAVTVIFFAGLTASGVLRAQQSSPGFSIGLTTQPENQKKPRVTIAVPETGHLILLDVWANGQVRVVFPARPSSSTAVPAGQLDLAALGVSTPYMLSRGAGTLVAVWSPTSFDFENFAVYGHWRVRELSRSAFSNQPIEASLGLVRPLTASPVQLAATEYDPHRVPLKPASQSADLSLYRRERALQPEVVNYLRIQRGCPSGSRDVTGAGESCVRPADARDEAFRAGRHVRAVMKERIPDQPPAPPLRVRPAPASGVVQPHGAAPAPPPPPPARTGKPL
jgi:hypothetical protein